MKNVMATAATPISSGDSFEFRILSALLDITGYSSYIAMKNVAMVTALSIISATDGTESGMPRSSDAAMRYVAAFVLEILNTDAII